MPDDELTQFRRLAKYKASAHQTPNAIGGDLLSFFKQGVQKRQPKLELVSRCWVQLVPEMFLEHTCLEAFGKGTLTVLVDSASHMFELKQLLLAGVEKQLIVACKSAGLKKINLRRGIWYDTKTGAPKF